MPKRVRDKETEMAGIESVEADDDKGTVKPQNKRQKQAHEDTTALIPVLAWLNNVTPVANGMLGLALASAPKCEELDDPFALETAASVCEAVTALAKTLSEATGKVDTEFKDRCRAWIKTHEEDE